VIIISCERQSDGPAEVDAENKTDPLGGCHAQLVVPSDFFRMLGETFDPLMREYGLGKIEWDDSKFIVIFGHCTLGVRIVPDYPYLVGFRSQAGLLTPSDVVDGGEGPLGVEEFCNLANAYREDRSSKLLPIRNALTFPLNHDGA